MMLDPIYIYVRYSCPQCGIESREVPVRERRPDEDVAHWVQMVCAVALSRDHDHVSPECQITELKDVYIPIPSSGNIGYAERH